MTECACVCLCESICALSTMDLTTCGLWDGQSLVINLEMQQPYDSHTYCSIPSVSLCWLTGSHQRLAATEWRDQPENQPIQLYLDSIYATVWCMHILLTFRRILSGKQARHYCYLNTAFFQSRFTPPRQTIFLFEIFGCHLRNIFSKAQTVRFQKAAATLIWICNGLSLIF